VGRKISLCLAAFHSRTHLLWILARDYVLANTSVHPRTAMMLTLVFHRTILFYKTTHTVMNYIITAPSHKLCWYGHSLSPPFSRQIAQPCMPIKGEIPWSIHMASVHLSSLLALLCVLTLLPLASCASKKTPKSKVSRSGHDLSHLATDLATWVRSWCGVGVYVLCRTLLAT